jgi:hypothetical protein
MECKYPTLLLMRIDESLSTTAYETLHSPVKYSFNAEHVHITLIKLPLSTGSLNGTQSWKAW